MWICTNKSFLSIVADRSNKENLLVRARISGHIENVFPDADVFTMEDADYKYRAWVSRIEVQSAMTDQISAINYDNFKDSVGNQHLHDAYLKIWSVMYSLQK
jgi:hypothetical protein